GGGIYFRSSLFFSHQLQQGNEVFFIRFANFGAAFIRIEIIIPIRHTQSALVKLGDGFGYVFIIRPYIETEKLSVAVRIAFGDQVYNSFCIGYGIYICKIFFEWLDTCLVYSRAVHTAPVKVAYFLGRSEEHTSELQSRENLVCRLLLEKKKN